MFLEPPSLKVTFLAATNKSIRQAAATRWLQQQTPGVQKIHLILLDPIPKM